MLNFGAWLLNPTLGAWPLSPRNMNQYEFFFLHPCKTVFEFVLGLSSRIPVAPNRRPPSFFLRRPLPLLPSPPSFLFTSLRSL